MKRILMAGFLVAALHGLQAEFLSALAGGGRDGTNDGGGTVSKGDRLDNCSSDCVRINQLPGVMISEGASWAYHGVVGLVAGQAGNAVGHAAGAAVGGGNAGAWGGTGEKP